MATTTQLAPGDWQSYFERFTATYLVLDEVPKAVTVEVLSLSRGDQIEALVERLLDLRYDPDRGMLDMSLEDRVIAFPPTEIWILEPDDPGCVSIVEVVRSDGSKDIVYVRRGGGLTRRYENA